MQAELSVAVVPEMVNGDFGSHPFSIGPRKATRVLAEVKGFCVVPGRSVQSVAFLRVL